MCDLCRALGSELNTLWHSSAQAFSGPGGATLIGYASSISQDTTVDPKIDGLLSGLKWSGTVTYSFTDSASDYAVGYGDGEPLQGFAQVSYDTQYAVDRILSQVEGFTNLNIEKNTEAGILDREADIRIAKTTLANPTAYTYYPNDLPDGSGGDIWIGTNAGLDIPFLDNYAYATHLHELGHALGLKHPHDTDNGATAMPAVDDGLEYSVMSYRSYPGQSLDVGYLTNEFWGFPQSFMRDDILALQEMYGADFSFNSDDTVYSWNPVTGMGGANRIFLTIWDGGGNDTYNMSNYSTPVSINLQPGLWSTTSNEQKAYLGNGRYAQGNVYNAFQYDNDPRSLIENAIGGSGNDVIIGNAADNMLEGRDGDDRLTGGAGDDRFAIWQGGGADVITDFTAGATDDDIYIGLSAVRSFAVLMSLASQQGDDTLFDFGDAGSVRLSNVLLENLTADDFVFSNPESPVNHGGPYHITLSQVSISESAVGGAVGSLTVLDVDGDTDFTFSVSDSRFEVAHDWFGNYTLKLKSGIQLDKEIEPSIGLDITAIDRGGFSLQKHFTIEVIDGAGATITGTLGNDWVDATHTIAGQQLPTINSDTIDGLQGHDTIYGLGGADILIGGLGNDSLYGGEDNDNLNGGEGNDFLYGEGGNDFIVGGAGNDYLYGHAGNDTLYGQAGVDVLYGDAGNDTFIVSGSEAINDIMSGGLGVDAIEVQGSGPVVLYLFNCYANSIEIWNGVGNVSGTSANDDLDFSLMTSANVFFADTGAGNDILKGTASAAQLKGGLGNDLIYGQAGDDLLYGQVGIDYLDGGDGNDRFFIAGSEALNDMMFGGAGNDAIVVEGALAATLTEFGADNDIEAWYGNGKALLGTSAANVFNFSALTYADLPYIDAGAGNDTLVGSILDLDLRGGTGNDFIIGGSGNESLYGGAGADNINGGAGNDTIYIAAAEASADTMQGGDGSDTIRVLGTRSVTLSNFNAGNNIEAWIGNNTSLVGTKAGDVLDFSGLTAKTGLLYIDGGSGNDTITGTSFADDLRGNGGNDILDGGAGNDLLNGGKGVDTYVFNGTFGNDTVVGFTAGITSSHDVIQFDDAQFANFADVMAHATQVGTNVVITLDGSNSVTLQSMTLVKLVDVDFQFV